MKLIPYFVVLISLAMPVLADVQFFVAPDRFEIEIANGVPSLRVSKTGEGVVARMTLVPAYDAATAAISYHHRDTRDEVEITRLSLDVSDVKLVNEITKSAVSIQRVEKERDRDRVGVRIIFVKDFGIDQARLLLRAPGVFGTVSGKYLCPEGVPEEICDWKKHELPAFNQFQAAPDKQGRAAFTKYTALNRYKAEVMAEGAGVITSGADLDRAVREALLTAADGKIRCREDLEPYEKWIAKMLLEQSSAGLLTEALDVLAAESFAGPLVKEDISRLVFDVNGKPVRSLSAPPAAAVKNPRRDVELPPRTIPLPRFETVLRQWGKAAIDATTYRQWLRGYVKWIFYDAKADEAEAIVESLMLMKSFEENSRLTRSLMSAAFSWKERFDNRELHGRSDTKYALVKRSTVSSAFEMVADYIHTTQNSFSFAPLRKEDREMIDKMNAGFVDELVTKYVEEHYGRETDEERAKLVAKFKTAKKLAGNPELNLEMLRWLFRELERNAKGNPPEHAK